MIENELGVEVIPGVRMPFLESGITGDAINAWMSMSFVGVLENFDKLKPVKRYGEYFQDQDRRYAAAGKPGLFKAIMERSNPAAVAEFDKLVDECNADLPRIIKQKDGEAALAFFRRAAELKNKQSDDQDHPK